MARHTMTPTKSSLNVLANRLGATTISSIIAAGISNQSSQQESNFQLIANLGGKTEEPILKFWKTKRYIFRNILQFPSCSFQDIRFALFIS